MKNNKTVTTEFKVNYADKKYNNIGITIKYEKFYRHNDYKHGYVMAVTLFNRTKATTKDGITFTTDEFAPYDNCNFRTILEPIPADKRFSLKRFNELVAEYKNIEKINEKIKRCGFSFSAINEPATVTIEKGIY